MEIVVVDVGGTHARFAMARTDGVSIQLAEVISLQTGAFASFQTAWEHFRHLTAGKLPVGVAIAVAGPVAGDVIRFTNNPWVIRPARICEQLQVPRYTLLNDFAAVGHAVARARAEDFIHLCGPEEPLPTQGVISVVGPGTGLGVA